MITRRLSKACTNTSFTLSSDISNGIYPTNPSTSVVPITSEWLNKV